MFVFFPMKPEFVEQRVAGLSHEYVTTQDFTIVQHAIGMMYHQFLHEFCTIGILHHIKFVEVIDY